MSDHSSKSVSWFSVAVVFIGFGLFLVVLKYTYLAHLKPAPHTVAAEQLPKDLEWKATPESRKAVLADLHKHEQTQASSYAWIDQAKGVVRLPIDRAMELTVQELAAKQQMRSIRDLPTSPR